MDLWKMLMIGAFAILLGSAALEARSGTFLEGRVQTYRVGLEGNANWEALDAAYSSASDCMAIAFDTSIESYRAPVACTETATRGWIAFPFPVYVVKHSMLSEPGTNAADDCAFVLATDEGTTQLGVEMEFGDVSVAAGGHLEAAIGVWIPANQGIQLLGRGTGGATTCSGSFGRAWWRLHYIPGD